MNAQDLILLANVASLMFIAGVAKVSIDLKTEIRTQQRMDATAEDVVVHWRNLSNAPPLRDVMAIEFNSSEVIDSWPRTISTGPSLIVELSSQDPVSWWLARQWARLSPLSQDRGPIPVAVLLHGSLARVERLMRVTGFRPDGLFIAVNEELLLPEAGLPAVLATTDAMVLASARCVSVGQISQFCTRVFPNQTAAAPSHPLAQGGRMT